MIQASHQRYVETGVNTASPVRLVIMLYDGAISFSLRAKRKLEEGDMGGKGEMIGRSIDIISELVCSLDMAAGGEMAVNLKRLYLYCIDRLIEANLNKDTKPIDAAVRVLCTLKEGWEGILKAESEGLVAKS